MKDDDNDIHFTKVVTVIMYIMLSYSIDNEGDDVSNDAEDC